MHPVIVYSPGKSNNPDNIANQKQDIAILNEHYQVGEVDQKEGEMKKILKVPD